MLQLWSDTQPPHGFQITCQRAVKAKLSFRYPQRCFSANKRPCVDVGALLQQEMDDFVISACNTLMENLPALIISFCQHLTSTFFNQQLKIGEFSLAGCNMGTQGKDFLGLTRDEPCQLLKTPSIAYSACFLNLPGSILQDGIAASELLQGYLA